MSSMEVITFYRFIEIEDPERLMHTLRGICNQFKIKGRILIGKEGINAGACGSSDAIRAFKDFLEADHRFKDLSYREMEVTRQVYPKLVVRTRDEVVVVGNEHDTAGKHVSPEEFKKLVENDDVLLLDTRNDYEFQVGKFKNAVTLPIHNFREFPQAIKSLPKDKKVIMYCTGGIRCEKASQTMKQAGFEDVVQLEGGIINYCQQYPGSLWEGGLYVFDERQVADVGSEPISACKHCHAKTFDMINCHNLDCDTRFTCCKDCQKGHNKTCSETCQEAPRQRPLKMKEIGRVVNYFAQKGVALIQASEDIANGDEIFIAGKTTQQFSQKIEGLRSDDGSEIEGTDDLFTCKVDNKVRKNDLVLVNAHDV